MLTFFMLTLDGNFNIKDLLVPILLSLVSFILSKLIVFVVMKIAGVVLDSYANNYIRYDAKETFGKNITQMINAIKGFLIDKLFRKPLYFIYGCISVFAIFRYVSKKGKKNIVIACLLVLLSVSMILVTGNYKINQRFTLYMPFFLLYQVFAYILL